MYLDDAPIHPAFLVQYPAIGRPFSGTPVLEMPAAAMVADLVEAHPPPAGSDLSKVTVRTSEEPGLWPCPPCSETLTGIGIRCSRSSPPSCVSEYFTIGGDDSRTSS